jgi:hypothetical protein
MGRAVTFINTRTRFQRISDARLFSGWVSFLSSKVAVVSVEDDVTVQSGQKFLFQVFGRDATATFEARLEVASGTLLAFALTSSIRNSAGGEEMRLRVQRMTAQIFSGPEPSEDCGEAKNELRELQLGVVPELLGEAQVVDISAKGLGMVANRAFAKEDRLSLMLDTSWGITECKVQVRYCKPSGKGFRIGVQILEMDRLNTGRYSRLLQSAAA